jgi:hypothetical protein
VTPPLPGGDAGANIEALSSVSRTLNFRLTVRDNRPYVPTSTIGQTQFTDMTVTVTNTSGPFKVTSPNTNINVMGGSPFSVTWNVTGTTGAPVSAANVKISLSTNGGNTFPTVLVASTPNDGSETVTIPNTASMTARIKVEPVGNVFFDCSDANFSITAPTATLANLGGRVTAANGLPLNNVSIILLDSNTSGTITISTGADGRFSFNAMQVGTGYLVTPNLAGYSFNPLNQFIPLNGERLDVNFVASTSTAQTQKAPFDFDGDGKTDASVFRSADSGWYIFRSSDPGMSTNQFGLASDRLVPADYDGDGKSDIAVFRQGAWYILRSSNGTVRAQQFGQNGDDPVPADYDGDATDDLAVFRQGTWYILNNDGGNVRAQQFGLSTDKPLTGDFDGDGHSDLAVIRNNDWYILQSTDGFRAQQFGLASDIFVPGDYDGDERTDLAVYRDGVWSIMRSMTGIFDTVRFGSINDTPTAGDYDGDGIWDVAVWRPSEGTWYVLRSSNRGFSAQRWGEIGDVPLPSVYNP